MTLIVFIFTAALNNVFVSEIDQLGRQGFAYIEAGNYEKALEKFNQILQLDKNNFEATLYKAGCLSELGKLKESLRLYSIAIGINPEAAIIYYNRGFTYQKNHQYNQAEKDYSTALDLDPSNTDEIPNDIIYNNLGIVYGIQENYDKAVIAYFNATRINKNYHEAHYNLGLAQEARGAFAAALESYQDALELEPENIEYGLAVMKMIRLQE